MMAHTGPVSQDGIFAQPSGNSAGEAGQRLMSILICLFWGLLKAGWFEGQLCRFPWRRLVTSSSVASGAPVSSDPWSGWMTAYYGGRDVSQHRNIVWSNGALDPWSGQGVYPPDGGPEGPMVQNISEAGSWDGIFLDGFPENGWSSLTKARHTCVLVCSI